ncbi:trimeric intracellular cation channel family protein [Raineyella fluvialis]|uniref:Trimeric intracellular cation channel family protein n=1 Tax=Raineyella fluvialis TaxID=2662261 RepID=A0A5Q2FGL7_9ACTN|nr:trimeric intracellular cation channel family protein [Raineyella fluvialis]QGF23446.1 trimeric intracellular cation channel family protein [Raineyella fluvialis]
MSGLSAAVVQASGFLDLTGVLSNAILGGVVARNERFDPIGFATLAIISGLGGGLIRDTLLQHGTPIALTDPWYVITALIGATIAFLIPVEGRLWNAIFPWIDALALGTWAVAGATKTLSVGLGALPAVILGAVTAVGGGAVREVLLRQVPSVFGGNTLYATPALVASGLLVLLNRLGHPTVGLVVGTLGGAGFMLLSRWRQWQLPEAYHLTPVRVWKRRSEPGETSGRRWRRGR